MYMFHCREGHHTFGVQIRSRSSIAHRSITYFLLTKSLWKEIVFFWAPALINEPSKYAVFHLQSYSRVLTSSLINHCYDTSIEWLAT